MAIVDEADLFNRFRNSIVLITSKQISKKDGTLAQVSHGTGFIFNSHGYVLTARHVLLPETDEYEVENTAVVGATVGPVLPIVDPGISPPNSSLDAMVLMLPQDSEWPSVNISRGGCHVGIGDPMYVLGFPTDSSGKVKTLTPLTGKLGGTDGGRNSRNYGWYRFNVGIKPGNSGSPVFCRGGYVIGVAEGEQEPPNSGGSDSSVELEFAIPIARYVAFTDAADVALLKLPEQGQPAATAEIFGVHPSNTVIEEATIICGTGSSAMASSLSSWLAHVGINEDHLPRVKEKVLQKSSPNKVMEEAPTRYAIEDKSRDQKRNAVPSDAVAAASANDNFGGFYKHPAPASMDQKASGGPGLVWVNSSSKVYHCKGDEWYGKTLTGSYVTEAEAVRSGAHAANGEKCN